MLALRTASPHNDTSCRLSAAMIGVIPASTTHVQLTAVTSVVCVYSVLAHRTPCVYINRRVSGNALNRLERLAASRSEASTAPNGLTHDGIHR